MQPGIRLFGLLERSASSTTHDSGTHRDGAKALVECYSMRIPLMARAITSCWISLVPSKIVWFTVSKFAK